MFNQLKGKLIHLASSFIYPILLFLTLFLFPNEMRDGKALLMTLLAIASLLWTITFHRRIRLIEDTATSVLNSAAQGFMAVTGTASLYDGEIVRGPHIDLPPMLWHRNQFFESWSGFILSDDKGRCTIDPKGAEVITPNYSYNDHYYNAIYPGEKIYVIGQLHTLKKHRNDFERNSLVSKKLREWKSKPINFLDYFDTNKDGKINEKELREAKHAATNFVDVALEEVYQNPATHVVSKSDDGRPFIVTSIHPDLLLTRYKRAVVFHAVAWVTLSIYTILIQTI